MQDVRDIAVDLPLGFVGSILAAPQCTLAQLSSEQGCPKDTTVGHIETEPNGLTAVDSGIWNLVPEKAYPAEFGYKDGSRPPTSSTPTSCRPPRAMCWRP